MTISNEFKRAVESKNILEARLMMKNSLLFDVSFESFREMDRFARTHGVDVWEYPAETGFTRKPAPWSSDDINFEITCIVNDFTKEHVSYLMEMIRQVYHNDIPSRKVIDPQPIQERSHKKEYPSERRQEHPILAEEYRSQIIIQLSEMTKQIKNRKIQKWQGISAENTRWSPSLLEEIRICAQNMIICCDKLQGRR